MNYAEFKPLINKYAILISIGYLSTFIFTNLIQYWIFPIANNNMQNVLGYLSSSSWVIQIVINIIAAILISKDLKKLELKNTLIIVMTLLFSLIGITMFFITINREAKEVV